MPISNAVVKNIKHNRYNGIYIDNILYINVGTQYAETELLLLFIIVTIEHVCWRSRKGIAFK